ncbi:MAG: hypothetical protein IKV54_05250 [Clostridia bacterium]|nr:hypothetical protein [Clostridia bacterium]
MYNYKVKRANKAAEALAAALLLLAVMFFIMSAAGIWIRSVLQLIMLVFLVLTIMVADRYLFSSFEYVINDKVGDYDLVVFRHSGKRTNTVCRLSLSLAGTFTVVKRGETPPRAVGQLHDYTGTLFAPEYAYITFPEENVTLKLEPDGYLKKLIPELMSSVSVAE